MSSLNTDNNNSKKIDTKPKEKQSINLGKNVAISNDSGIHVDGLDINSQLELASKSKKDSFQLPSWLANNQPIPEELLAKHSAVNHYEHDDDDADDYQHPSAFYAFSFIDFSGDNEDTWSMNSSNTPNNPHIRDEMKTCVETLHTCLNNIREMNEQKNEINEDIRNLLNELIDQVEKSIEKDQLNENEIINISLDYNLLNELFTKKLAFKEYLSLLDQLIDNKYVKITSKTGEDASNEINLLSEQIEQYRTTVLTETNDSDNQLLLSNAQSNYSVISFLQQSISMDMSLITTNDLTNQIQSTSIQQTSTIGGKTADIGRFF